MSRTRNIKEFHYYCDVKVKEPSYESLDAVEKYYSNINNGNTMIANISTCLNCDDTMTVIKNSFFDLYCYQEYMHDIFNTNKIIHFENILTGAGFIVNSNDDINDVKLSKIDNKAMNLLVENIEQTLFTEYTENVDKRDDSKFDNININVDAVGLRDVEHDILLEYQDVITDKFKLIEHFNIIRCMKDDEYIKAKIAEHEQKSFNVLSFNNIYNKIKLIRELEADNKIKKLTIGADNGEPIVINSFDQIKKVFRTVKEKPKNWEELLKLLVSMYRHIMGNDVITSLRCSKTKKYNYTYNYDKFKKIIKLDTYNNTFYKNYDVEILQLLNIEKPIRPEKIYIGNLDNGVDDIFID
jgi:hypothetical protein